MDSIVELVNQYGVPIVVAVGMAYFIYYIWKFVTTNILPSLGQASSTLIALIDRVRMLDNDMIRLETKLNMVLEYKEEYEKMTGKKLDIDIEDIEKIKEQYTKHK